MPKTRKLYKRKSEIKKTTTIKKDIDVFSFLFYMFFYNTNTPTHAKLSLELINNMENHYNTFVETMDTPNVPIDPFLLFIATMSYKNEGALLMLSYFSGLEINEINSELNLLLINLIENAKVNEMRVEELSRGGGNISVKTSLIIAIRLIACFFTIYYQYKTTIALYGEIKNTKVFYPMMKGLIKYAQEQSSGIQNDNFISCILRNERNTNTPYKSIMDVGSMIDNRLDNVYSMYSAYECIGSMLSKEDEIKSYFNIETIKKNPSFYKSVFEQIEHIKPLISDAEEELSVELNNSPEVNLNTNIPLDVVVVSPEAYVKNTEEILSMFSVVSKAIGKTIEGVSMMSDLYYESHSTIQSINQHKLHSTLNQIEFFRREALNDYEFIKKAAFSYGNQTFNSGKAILVLCALFSGLVPYSFSLFKKKNKYEQIEEQEERTITTNRTRKNRGVSNNNELVSYGQQPYEPPHTRGRSGLVSRNRKYDGYY